MGDENPIRTIGDYSKPSHEGYKNTIEVPIKNNVVPLRSNTISIAWKTPKKPLLTTHPRVQMKHELNSMLESLGLVPQFSNMKFVCSKKNDGDVLFIEIIRDNDEPQNGSLNEGEGATTEGATVEYLDTFPTRDELTYHKMMVKEVEDGFMKEIEKLKWWFEQDIDDGEEKDEEDKCGGEV
nr:hypothetical protein [Tanacetum cinerariifolium]